jgi:hypothetical protein
MNLKLGVLYKDGKIVNHRSFIKVMINPLLRRFGKQIATMYDKRNQKLGMPTLMNCNKTSNIKWDFNDHHDFDKLEKTRTII